MVNIKSYTHPKTQIGLESQDSQKSITIVPMELFQDTDLEVVFCLYQLFICLSRVHHASRVKAVFTNCCEGHSVICLQDFVHLTLSQTTPVFYVSTVLVI